jgi:hypothetical protein
VALPARPSRTSRNAVWIVLQHGHVLAQARQLQFRAQLAALEQRLRHLRRERPAARAASEQVAQFRAGKAQRRRQRQAGEEGGAGGADFRIRRHQRVLGLQDVGTARQQVRRQAGRQLRQHRLAIERPACRQVRRQRRPEQQFQVVARK